MSDDGKHYHEINGEQVGCYSRHRQTVPMTIEQAAERLSLAPATLRHQARAGKLRAEKYGRDWLVAEEEVERYRREHKR